MLPNSQGFCCLVGWLMFCHGLSRADVVTEWNELMLDAIRADNSGPTLASRASDGSQTDVPYVPSDAPGQWRRTPPFFRPPYTPQWRYVTLFCLAEVESFLPPPPPELESPEYAEAFNQVKALGSKNSTV